MRLNRRSFVRTAVGLSCCAGVSSRAGEKATKLTVEQLDRAASEGLAGLGAMPVFLRGVACYAPRVQWVRTGSPFS